MRVFSEEVAKQRSSFVIWLCRHFRYRHNNTERIVELDTLYDTYRNTVKIQIDLKIEDMTDILNEIGFLNERINSLNLVIKLESLHDVSYDYLLGFMSIASAQEKSEIKKLMNIAKVQKELNNGSIIFVEEEQHLLTFYNLWCINTNKVRHFKLDETFTRTIMGNLKRAYQIFCTRNNIIPVEHKLFRKFMIQQGHREGTGYACQRSGQSYLRNLYIPGNGGFTKMGGFRAEEEISMTTKYNQLLVRIGDQYYQNNGAQLNDISDNNIEEVTLRRIHAMEVSIDVPVCADTEYVDNELIDADKYEAFEGIEKYIEQKEYYSRKEDEETETALLNVSEAVEELKDECEISEETKKLLANLDFDVEKTKEDFAKKRAGE